MHLFLGKPHVGSTDPFLTPHAKVSTRRSDARQSQGNYEDWKPLLKKTFCCLFIQQFLDMLVEIKIERVGSTIIQFPPSRRHGWAITCALLCSPYHQLSIGNRSEYLTCFLNIACDCEGSNMLYINLVAHDASHFDLDCRCKLKPLHLQACWFRAGHHNEPKTCEKS